ncbi:NAD-dependent epimerase/dehydratase family protein [Actibacterium ureilyticum]|uniref:NAD-dependent epimerase/dehydratase family protein n=1 Tax=Actibacterium ureilyticum TaxID=1590614 RepID=UPI000BAAE7DB|nr:NAD(P)-dependent oxidoreductase [Actibacterium ureilyticum]
MRVAITGGTGLVGRFLVQDALAAGDRVTLLSRTTPDAFAGPAAHLPYGLGETPDLKGHDVLIHCAFAHVPGRYRGGEGDDPAGFTRANLDGSIALFQAARDAAVPRVIFLSSRAVYGAYAPGTTLTEDLPPKPDTLYGQVKWQAEQWLADAAAHDFTPISLRATGVYGPAGPGQAHKWTGLFADYLSGQPIAPRRGTELHGDDLARAVRIARDAPTGAYNLSDITLDRHDLLALVARETGCTHPLPARSDAPVSAMDCTRMHALGWRPGGMARLRSSLPALMTGPGAVPAP